MAAGPWQPAAHGLFGPAVHGWVWLALLIQKRLESPAVGKDGGADLTLWLPPEMWMHVLSFMKQNRASPQRWSSTVQRR